MSRGTERVLVGYPARASRRAIPDQDLMKELYPVFNAAEAEVVAGLSPRSLAQLTNSLRSIVTELETKPTAAITDEAS